MEAQHEIVKNLGAIFFIIALFAAACAALWHDKDITKGPK